MAAVLGVLSAASLIRDALRVAIGLAIALLVAAAFTIACLAALFAPRAPAPVASAPTAAGVPLAPLQAAVVPLAPSAYAAQPALNQYAPGNYSSTAAWARWKDAACSAASLTWLLRAYGMPIGTIDQSVGLIGDGTGISAALGLLDASGRPLARAIASLGLVPRNANLGRSPATLEAWLDRGPLALDGAAWYGVGHWFVAYAYDASGVFTRDSSGHDVRYLSWAQLYGSPVGFSGNAVGIVAGG